MTSAAMNCNQDTLDRYLNSYACQSFRDQADRDYIAARLACRYELFPQFLWASQQAIEKYLKAILLFNRIKARNVGHDLREALRLLGEIPFEIKFSKRTKGFLEHIATYGQYRYLDVPFFVVGFALVDLDLCIWELRRYCQVLQVFGKTLPANEQAMLVSALKRLEESEKEARCKFSLSGGLLEAMLRDTEHPSRPALIWQNPCYGSKRRKIKVKDYLNGQNPHLTHFPEMLDELLKYVFIPPAMVKAYKAHALAKLGER